MIKLLDIHKYYGKGESLVKALNGINIEIQRKEMVAIMGRSGSGKSTLLNIIGTLDNPQIGEYFFNDNKLNLNNQKENSEFRRNNVGFILQNYTLINSKSVFENVSLPLKYNRLSKSEIDEKVKQTLKQLQIIEKINSYPNELSGGQAQRVAIARAIINNPKVILADEPTGSLDVATESEIIQILKNLNKKDITIIIVTHESEVAKKCDRIIRLSDGKVV